MSKKSKNYKEYSGTLTNVNIWGAFGLTLLLGGIVHSAIFILLEDTIIYEYFFERGAIPHITALCFWFAISVLLLKVKKIGSEKKPFTEADTLFKSINKIKVSTKDDGDFKDPKVVKADKLIRDVENKLAGYKQKILVNRIHKALMHLENTNSTDDLVTVLNTQSDVDRSIVDSSYGSIKFLSGVIPILGFVGTVYGISVAITGFTAVLENASSFEAVKPQLNFVTHNLGIAFDTTFLALVFSGIILFVNALIQKREEDLLSAVDKFCLDNLVSKSTIVSLETQEMKDSFQSNSAKIIQALSQVMGSIGMGIKRTNEHLENIENRVSVMAPGGNQDLGQYLNSINQSLIEVKDQIINLSKQESQQNLSAVIEKMGDIADKFSNLGNIGDAFSGIGQFEKMIKEMQKAIINLDPAIAKLSDEMADKVNNVLERLLKVNIFVHNVDKFPKGAFKNLNVNNVFENLET